MTVGNTNIGGVDVPAAYVVDINDAASQLGIPPSIVAQQIYYESGFNPNATSPTGAEGLAQFEPYTFKDLGISGSPYTPSVAFEAYVKYMGQLLTQEKGDVFNALAAYNAGPGNLSAGDGYAQHIFSGAGLFKGLKQGATGKIPTSPIPGTTGGIANNQSSGGLISWPSDILNSFKTMDSAFADVYKAFELFFKPSTWVRAGAGFFGFLFIIIGIVCLAREAKAQ